MVKEDQLWMEAGVREAEAEGVTMVEVQAAAVTMPEAAEGETTMAALTEVTKLVKLEATLTEPNAMVVLT